MSDYHREYADQADARIRELEDKLAGAVEVLNGAGVKMCELIDQLAAYKVAVGNLARLLEVWETADEQADLKGQIRGDYGDNDNWTKETGHLLACAIDAARDGIKGNPICKAAIDAAKGGE